MKITNEKLVINAKDVKNKNDVFNIFADLLKENKLIKTKAELVKAFKKREAQMTTGLGNGIAIPHAASSEIEEPKILVAKLDKLDWKSLDNKPVDVAIAIVVPEGQRKEHFELLASISSKFMDEDVIEKFKNYPNSKIVEFLNNLEVDKKKKTPTPTKSKDNITIVGVTTCTTGVAHTFMAAKAIEDEANKRGWNVKVEKQGQMTKDRLTDKDIESADYVLIAAGKGIDNPERFVGKKVYETDVASPITQAEKVLDDLVKKASVKGDTSKKSKVTATAESKDDPKKHKKKFGTGPIKHLLAGISYMIPFIAMAGITLGVTTAFGFGTLPIDPVTGTQSFGPLNPTAEAFSAIAGAAFTLYIPILAGFIANSVVGRHAIAPAMIVALALADPSGSILYNYQAGHFGGFDGDGSLGFFGAIAAGYLVGYGIKWSEKYTDKVDNRAFQTMLPLLIIPIFWTIVPMMFFAFIGYLPLYYLAFGLKELVKVLVDANLIWLAGMLLGMMVCFDLGGPVNKMAMLIGVLFLDASTYYPAINGILAVAVALPPTVLMFSLFLGKFFGLKLDETDKAAAGTASVMGFFGITEGAIPFAAKNPKLWIPSFMFAGAVGGTLASFTGVGNNVAMWGGPIIYIAGGMGQSASGVVNTATEPFMESDWVYSLLYFVPLLIGGLSGFFMAASLNRVYTKQDIKKMEDPEYRTFTQKVGKKLFTSKKDVASKTTVSKKDTTSKTATAKKDVASKPTATKKDVVKKTTTPKKDVAKKATATKKAPAKKTAEPKKKVAVAAKS